MSLPERIYTAALHAASTTLPLLARGGGKVARGVRGRRGTLERMAGWAAAGRDARRPLVWFHAPSVGEGLQARAVIEALRERRPDAQVVYTYFSPSAEEFARRLPVDFSDYLPLDLPFRMGAALDLLRPAAVVFTKTEVWPNLTREAARRGVRMALLSATLPAGSSRLRGPARTLLRAAHRRLDRVAAISEEDARRFAALGVPEQRRAVMGDARFDQVWRRAHAVDRGSELLRGFADPSRPVIVAGSTWPPDEQRLLRALAEMAGAHPFRLLLVPHEPTADHLREAERRLDQHGLPRVRLSERSGTGPDPEVVLVDRVGVLGELYAVGDVAYVGGGWGTAGLHSVLEPAAFGLPVLFGPRHSNAREAGELVARGGGFAAENDAALAETLRSMLADEARRRWAGQAAREYVRRGLGAAARGAEVVEELLDGAGG